MGGLGSEPFSNLSAFSLREPEDLLMICPQHTLLSDLQPHTHIQGVTVRGEGDIKEKERELWSDE